MLEVSKQEVDEYYSPKDFQLGKTITLLRRCFQLYDFDGFTKEYYQKNHPDMEMKPIEFPKKTDTSQVTKKVRNWNVFVIFSSFVFFYKTSVLPESMWLTVVICNVFLFLSMFTGGSSLQWFWFTWRLSPELFVFNSPASQKEHTEDARKQQQSAALHCQAGEKTLWMTVNWSYLFASHQNVHKQGWVTHY